MEEKSLLKLLREEDSLVEEVNDIVRGKEGVYNIVATLERDKERIKKEYKGNEGFLNQYVKEQNELIAKHIEEIPGIEKKEKDVRDMLVSVRKEIVQYIKGIENVLS